ncbi:polysaccharide biosynthesis protein [Synergistaceae bacterium OttesenSCG-928-I11]|nr:polysaccharide biosynthesis protein [Synergistaceae bacterium OttesenSCG-928-I11]
MLDIRDRILRSWLLFASRNRRVLLLDFVLLAFAVYIGYALRLSLLISPAFRGDLAIAALLFPLCVTFLLWLCGIYRVHWPQASVEEYAKLTRSYLYGSTLFLCANFFVDAFMMPRSSLAIALLSGIVFLGAARASWRLVELSGAKQHTQHRETKKALIIGAGEAGAFIARDLLRRHSELSPLGFIDDDPQKRDKIIAGLPVLGNDESLEEVARRYGAKVALIAIPSASGANMRKYLDTLSHLGVEVRVLPSLHELAGGRVELASMRSVELQDLLRRDAIVLDEAGIGSVVTGKRILVTGAGGSIGSELCTQIARHMPAEILMLGHGEQSIYNVLQNFAERGIDVPRRSVIADIADTATMERIFRENEPDVVFHAAAHKHVPLMEENPREALRVNSFGTWTLATLAGSCGVERFVMISTDKAVHPSSVMGATKRIAERLLRTAQASYPDTAYMTVRFGNVLGSRGSVVPLFERQIAQGGPVTVTHPDMTRYFMLIPEAVSLVLQAASMGNGGELFVLDMGEPVRITEMAETLIRLHGREPHQDIEIVYTGIRPGEKLFEELFYDPDHVDRTRHEKIFLSRLDEEPTPLAETAKRILTSGMQPEAIRAAIFKLAKE